MFPVVYSSSPRRKILRALLQITFQGLKNTMGDYDKGKHVTDLKPLYNIIENFKVV